MRESAARGVTDVLDPEWMPEGPVEDRVLLFADAFEGVDLAWPNGRRKAIASALSRVRQPFA